MKTKDICSADSQHKIEDTSSEVIDLGTCIPSRRANEFLRERMKTTYYKKYGKTLNI